MAGHRLAEATPFFERLCPAMTLNLSVAGLVREHAGIDPDLAQRAVIFLLDIVAEDQIGIGVAMQPSIILDFAFELPRRPSGVAEREHGMFRAGAPRDRLQDVDGGRETDLVVDP